MAECKANLGSVVRPCLNNKHNKTKHTSAELFLGPVPILFCMVGWLVEYFYLFFFLRQSLTV